MQPDQPQQGSKISNTEWAFLIGAAVFLDFTEAFLDTLLIGIIANEFIDLLVGMALPLYFHKRGIKKDKKTVGTWVVMTLFEFITDGVIPIGWTFDVVLTMVWDKRNKKLSKLPI
jgi:hypothetical protein